jgi:hypothetical protein
VTQLLVSLNPSHGGLSADHYALVSGAIGAEFDIETENWSTHKVSSVCSSMQEKLKGVGSRLVVTLWLAVSSRNRECTMNDIVEYEA